MRWSRGLKPKEPGNLVELDTLTMSLFPGKVVKAVYGQRYGIWVESP